MKSNKSDYKALVLRIPKDHWIFIKKRAIDQEISINQLITNMIEKLKKRNNKNVDKSDSLIS